MLEERGLPVMDPTPFLSEALAREGVLGRHQPTEEELGRRPLRAGAGPRRRPARSGPDGGGEGAGGRGGRGAGGDGRLHPRGGELAKGGAVVVKAVKPQQDRRFDLPAVGPSTIESMKKAGCRVLAVEAGATLVMDLEELVRQADKAGIAVVGLR